MFRYRIPSTLIVFLGLAFLLGACRGDSDGGVVNNDDSESGLEVVVFATPVPATPMPGGQATNTPLPEPVARAGEVDPPPVEAEEAAVVIVESEPTATPGFVRAENENPLTGLILADPTMLQHRPLHVRLGNDPQARPQVNLSQADIVYEEIVEWWITRLTAIYYGETPEMIAPVRSARLINGQLTAQYDAALINSGGSDGVRWELSQLPIINLDEYFHPNPYFYREDEPWQRRLAVNSVEAHAYMAEEDLQHPVQLRGFYFDEVPPDGQLAESVYIDYPSKDSKVLWRFNMETDEYERYVAGEPYIDGATDEIISVSNVIVYFAPHYETEIVEDSTGATSVGIELNGEGPAWIFRDHALIEGRWRTDGLQTPEFVDAAGELIPLRPGRSWIQVVPLEYEILVNEEPEGDT